MQIYAIITLISREGENRRGGSLFTTQPAASEPHPIPYADQKTLLDY
jgi:hypothetical protein